MPVISSAIRFIGEVILQCQMEGTEQFAMLGVRFCQANAGMLMRETDSSVPISPHSLIYCLS